MGILSEESNVGIIFASLLIMVWPRWRSRLRVWLVIRSSRVRSPSVRQHHFVIDHDFYGHSLPSIDSRRAVVSFWRNITKTRLYNFDPLKPDFYLVKLGFTGVYIIFLISVRNIDCEYSLEPPRRGGSNEYPQSMFWAETWKISEFFYLKNFIFWWWNFQYIWIGVFS